MRTWSQLLLFLHLGLSICVSAAIGDHNNSSATIQIINGMPANSEPVQVRCSSKYADLGVHTLGTSQDYVWSVGKRALYFCEAMCGRYFASWHAFQPRRDVKHPAVFWLVKEDGFYRSWDKKSWVRKARWETE